jgi:phosphoesterase RecJ-like protein
MKKIEELFTEPVASVGIAGHVNPDGDCAGSCTALYRYLKKNMTFLSEVDLYLEEPKESLRFLAGYSDALHTAPAGKVYDLFITCDVSVQDRIGVAGDLFLSAKKTACIDHHVSNEGFAEINCILPDASSCSEVLADLFEPEKIDSGIAADLYTGIIHDSGVFQYSNTSPHTMRTAAMLMEKGIDHNKLIDDSFNIRSFAQNRILGCALEKAGQVCGGKIVTSFLTIKEMEEHGVTARDLDMIVSQLRLTEGAEAAAFIYETVPGTFKISLRSNHYLDVSAAAAEFGGGGHVRAAGATLTGSAEEVFKRLIPVLEKRL